MTGGAARAGPRERNERPWRDVTLAFVVSVSLFVINPFGTISAVERYGQQLFNQLFAPALYGDGSRELTAVVLLQDRDLADLGLSWPAPYGQHARILAAIRELRPRALMIDFLFVDRRPDATLGELVEELRSYRDSGIPVFLARPPVRVPRPDVLPELGEPLTTLVPVPRLIGEGGDSAYSLFFVQCEAKSGGDPSCQPVARRTPAAEIYRALCNKPDRRAWFCRSDILDIDRHAAGLDAKAGKPDGRRIEVFWGANPDPVSARGLRCKTVPDRFGARLLTLLRSGGDALRLDCPFTPTVSAARLLDVRMPEDDADLAKLIGGRVVFYGANLLGASDVIQPPAHEPLAGVYAHAMAFDNLLTFGANYKRERILVLGGVQATPRTFQILVVFVLQVPLLFLFLRYQARLLNRRRFTETRQAVVNVMFAVGYAVLATVIVLFLTVTVEFGWLNLTPANWLQAVMEVLAAKHLAVNLGPVVGKLPRVGLIRTK